ncbi:MAG: helix-turn-helix domain-containing protein [Sphaerochaetaceae bacterium]|nr:helix-turn-helix domain-containing protein [Sphaerochaetaceae bacterium]
MEKKTILDTFAENLKSCRKALKLTQAEMAKQIGVSTSFITEIETGRKAPSFGTIEKISKVTNTPAWAFFNDNFGKGIEIENNDLEKLRMILKETTNRNIDIIIDELVKN